MSTTSGTIGAAAAGSAPRADSSAGALEVPTIVLLVGGYGVVGAQAARILRDRNPAMRLLIGGRTLEKAGGTCRATR